MSNLVNPDTRPLPSGWNQHYDTHTDVWYYVCMNVRPPTVSTTHPLGPIPERNISSASLPSPEYSFTQDLSEAERSNSYPLRSLSPISPSLPPAFDAFPEPRVSPVLIQPPPPPPPIPSNPVRRPLPSTAGLSGGPRPPPSNPPATIAAPVQPRTTGLTFAQQLYSSSVRTTPVAPVRPQQTASGSIPTPPTSPQPQLSRSAAPILPPPPPPNAISTNDNDLFTLPAVPESRAYASRSHRTSTYSAGSSPSLASFPRPTTHSSATHSVPHRAQAYQPSKPTTHANPHRASTIATTGISKPRGVPQLVTTARPPPNSTHTTTKSHTTPSFQNLSPPSQLPLQNATLVAPVPSYPTPPNSSGPAATLTAAAYGVARPHSQSPITPAMQVQLAYQLQQAQQAAGQVQPQNVIAIQQNQPQVQIQMQPQPQNMVMNQQSQPQIQVQMQPQPQSPPAPPQQQQSPQSGVMQQMGVGLGKFALGVAGGAVASSLGFETNGIAGAIGGALMGATSEDGGDVGSSVIDGLVGMVSGDQASGNSSGGMDYQSILAAMAQQNQQQQPQQPPQELAQFQVALAQQQAQQQLLLQQQALQQQAQQQQVQQAIAQQQQAQQAMAQQQAQQQAAVAAALQQQQQQTQLQMQIQLLQQQQQQQQPQVMAPQQNAGQPQPSPLGTLLTGLGQAFSSMATDNTNTADQGGTWDAYASFFNQEE